MVKRVYWSIFFPYSNGVFLTTLNTFLCKRDRCDTLIAPKAGTHKLIWIPTKR